MMRRDEILDRVAIALVVRQEHQPGAVRTLGRERERTPTLRRNASGVWIRMPGAVAGVRFAAARAAMFQVDEHLQRLRDDVVRPLTLDVDDETDAAGVAFV